MPERFKAHLHKFTAATDDEAVQILSYFQTRTVGKKENLLTTGQVCQWLYFVERGILRKFYVNEKGVEQTTELAIENWWITDHFAYESQSITESTIQAVEPTDVLALHRDAREKLLAQHPVMEKYFRCVYQKAYAAAQMWIKFMYGFSREELYHHFCKKHPEFLQRIPQYLLASYLCFTPEYLSEIRRKSIS